MPGRRRTRCARSRRSRAPRWPARPGSCSAISVLDVGVDRAPAAAPAGVGRGLDHAAVERRERAPAREHHAVARVRGAGIDAEDDHHGRDSGPADGRLPGGGSRPAGAGARFRPTLASCVWAVAGIVLAKSLCWVPLRCRAPKRARSRETRRRRPRRRSPSVRRAETGLRPQDGYKVKRTRRVGGKRRRRDREGQAAASRVSHKAKPNQPPGHQGNPWWPRMPGAPVPPERPRCQLRRNVEACASLGDRKRRRGDRMGTVTQTCASRNCPPLTSTAGFNVRSPRSSSPTARGPGRRCVTLHHHRERAVRRAPPTWRTPPDGPLLTSRRNGYWLGNPPLRAAPSPSPASAPGTVRAAGWRS